MNNNLHHHPYLSIVVASRNDNYGGDLLLRMQHFIRGLDQQVQRFNMNVELIIVEWNPPLDNSNLYEVLPVPSKDSPLVIRYIIVPNEVHQNCVNDKLSHIPFFEYLAKNVGIRRSYGDYVLCTNVDILFSDGLCSFLAQQNLEPNKFYRANRCDVPHQFLTKFSLEDNIKDKLNYCSSNIIKRRGMIPKFYGYVPAHFSKKQIIKRYFPGILKKIKDSSKPILFYVDPMAPGDFTLMSKDAWEKIRGYYEIEVIHALDTLAVFTAYAKGYKEVIMYPGNCAFHIEHEQKRQPMQIYKYLKGEAPYLPKALRDEAINWILQHQGPLPINSDDWGCNNFKLYTKYVDSKCCRDNAEFM